MVRPSIYSRFILAFNIESFSLDLEFKFYFYIFAERETLPEFFSTSIKDLTFLSRTFPSFNRDKFLAIFNF